MTRRAGMNPLLAFHLDEGPDDRGRFRSRILGHDDDWLEHTHDCIQWLFPLVQASRANPSAPVLDGESIEAFLREPSLRASLDGAYRRMLSFYGLARTGGAVVKGPNWRDRKGNWFVEPTHNDLRITRILGSLSLLGLRVDALQLLACLESLRSREPGCGFSGDALDHWTAAVACPAPGTMAPSRRPR